METILQGEMRVPIKTWLPVDEIEAGALEQLTNAASHPEVAVGVAAMPDTHVGFGVSIGCVFPTANAVLPNAVGVDIGCGMCALETGIALDRERMDKTFWRAWSGQVNRNVPTGFNIHKQAQALGDLDRSLRAEVLQPLLCIPGRVTPVCASPITTTGTQSRAHRSARSPSARISPRCHWTISPDRTISPTCSGRPISHSPAASR
jgi:hypothetical protein